MIKTIIIDDELRSCDVLKKILLNYCSEVEVLAVAHNAADGQKLVKLHKPDLVFLDIEMPGGDGFYFLDQCAPVNFKTIFTTAYDKYAIKAIKYSAFDYLLKPIGIDQVKTALSRLPENVGEKSYEVLKQNFRHGHEKGFYKLAIPTLNGYEFVGFENILWMQASDNYTIMHLKEKKQLVSSHNLGYYEDMLADEHPFIRIHHSYIINMNHIQRLTKKKQTSVVMSDGKELDVSVRKKDMLLALING